MPSIITKELETSASDFSVQNPEGIFVHPVELFVLKDPLFVVRIAAMKLFPALSHWNIVVLFLHNMNSSC